MKPKKPRNLEDFLSGRHASDSSGELPPEQQKLTEHLKNLFQENGNEQLNDSEKEALWATVQQSTSESAGRRSVRLPVFRIAATVSLLLLAGFGLYFYGTRPDSGMQLAAERAAASDSATNTQLILSDEQTISLSNDESEITYQENGANIRLDSGSVIDRGFNQKDIVYNTLVVPYGKRSTLTLHDGTKVWLNSGSKLVYPARFSDRQREVYLDGEAYFAVRHDASKPFYVQTKALEIEVLGTEFDVSAYSDDAESYAVLARGSIELTANKDALFGKIKKKLVPGTRALYNPSAAEVQVASVRVEEYTAWKDGYLILSRVPLNEILKKLARYYRVELAVESTTAGQETFSGKLDLQDDITHVLSIICTTTSLSYEQHERRFVLKK
ncbi:FecR family protein [Persicitalea jodogahamensis]|uniref:Anti-sigma factor n=1 Tax=Persicitalea jodogahamensis TaxID=402147 RepID=A0A8J3D1C1_9BACT|nr:FecR domain-containing protein [Persicitalea jodogahamensis]GHB54429.1 anti-sigma factor [Persicitalea jodogahamensis]